MKRLVNAGFTLIELSIVLVIIGLVVGGILTGRDLISTAAARAQISQIERYHAATNAFRGKYGYLPGDISDPTASQFGFQARGQYTGEGDGNGLLEGVSADAPGSNSGANLSTGETVMFWRDLSDAKLIEGGFTTASSTGFPAANVTLATSPAISAYIPAAKIGGNNYVYAFSGGWQLVNVTDLTDRKNYFGVSAITSIGSNGVTFSNVGLTVQQAYDIDRKMDDGMPQTGKVLALNLNGAPLWAIGPPGVIGAFWNSGFGSDPRYWGPTTAATAYATNNCFDNNNAVGPQQYSMANAATVNCSLVFQFQ